MLNPKYQRYAERLKELIEEGQAVAGLERTEDSLHGLISVTPQLTGNLMSMIQRR
jgi:hypothetical protein